MMKPRLPCPLCSGGGWAQKITPPWCLPHSCLAGGFEYVDVDVGIDLPIISVTTATVAPVEMIKTTMQLGKGDGVDTLHNTAKKCCHNAYAWLMPQNTEQTTARC
jgi:hypothetical protein